MPPATATSASITANAPPVVLPGTGNNIIINPLQRGNPVLECIRNVGKEFGDIVADYQVGRTTGVLFLSLKYHRLHPEYIHIRVEKLGHSYGLRILLVLSDITEHRDPIRELTKMCIINNITVLVAFSFDEAGHYLSIFKQFEHKPPDMIKERVDKDYNSVLRSSLTSISKVNKTDVETLRTSFGSFANIAKATSDQLQNLPGFGQVKVKNIKNAFEKPIRNTATSSLSFQASQRRVFSNPVDEVAPGDLLGKGKGKGKEKEKDQPSLTTTSKDRQRVRDNSLIWDIELDLDEAADERGPPPDSPSSLSKGASVAFDIELDLN